ncbi:MAG: large subunit ribosomal protein L21 [Candidatus Azotimanducaceae bacterium]|jgi:large subunit ribosomal protein L21
MATTDATTEKKSVTAKKAVAAKAVVKKAPAKKEEKVLATDFAVIETGGKQYVVSVGDVIDVELLGEHEEGEKVEFDKVLMSDDGASATIGDPYIKGAKVKATYVAFKKGKKISILRYKAKSNRSRKIGHRQKYSTVEITALA